MKKIALLLIIAITFCNQKLRAQDDLAGWFVDGVKVDKLTCYSFGSFQVAAPYNSEWEIYDYISVHIYKGKNEIGGVKLLPMKAIRNYIKGTTLVYTIYKDNDISNEEGSLLTNGSPEGNFIGVPDQSDQGIGGQTTNFYLFRWMLKYEIIYMGKPKPLPDMELSFDLYGVTKIGTEEKYSNDCNCIKKTTQYTSKKLTKTYNLICTERTERKGKDKVDPSEFTIPCSYPGIKVDFSGKSTSNNSSNSNDGEQPSPPIKSTTTTTPKTTTSSFATSTLNAKSVKPLDKTKPGYFTEKNDAGKIIREGYKKGKEVLIGEIRMYDDEGRLQHIYTYANDEQEGYTAEYDPETGNLLNSGNYKAGQKYGEWKRYKNGKVVGTDTYVDGELQ